MDWIKDIKPVLELLNGLVSPFLAVTVVYIAFQQWKTNDRKERRESREIKISIYKRVKSHLNYIDSTRRVRTDLYENFKQASAEADFIFPKEISEYLDDIDSCSSQWLVDVECVDTAAPDADQGSVARLENDMEKYIDTLQNSHCDLLNIFGKYIDGAQPKKFR